MSRVKIYDTTLRDGMQAEGVSFSLQDKLLIAKRLDQLGVDYIEGGYAASNQKEKAFFEKISEIKLENSKICAFGSTRRADVKVEDDVSINAILSSGASAATIVGKCWDMHVDQVLRCSRQANLDLCADSVRYLKEKGLEVLFDAEHFFDGYKNNPEYALEVLRAAAEAGADALVLCETNGGCLPEEVYEITKTVCYDLAGTEIGIHTHNDSDCAVANSLAAVRAGAREVQGTINGIGERTGNANLCSIIPNLKFKMGHDVLSEEKLSKLTETSLFVFEIANISPVTSLPFVGESAFAHKAGLHVNALRKNKATYEHITPELVGNSRRFLVSELSGMSNVLAKLEKHGQSVDRETAKKILNKVQTLENEGYQFEAADGSFDLLIKRIKGEYTEAFELERFHISVSRDSHGDELCEATIKLSVGGDDEHVVSEGDGPVNAMDKALRKSLERFYPQLKDMHLIDYKVRVVNAKAATAAKVRVIIESRDLDSVWGTVGVSENVVNASWIALKDSIEYKLLKDNALKK
ncbi:2-isopropylmalate synthase [Sedimentisphaera cyanobacteriorum]|uniref:Citramalate synthase n=1 Tax=Sedimentisphaera cyanobacteriorum TaxID=1940790 RepID=A0A1Q2HR72_9BACT|nr:citramalate synthase [Sedimentisphaera cyanobacteriorum]AQQ09735.1 2-isopropylmalate synthase [Sedimentisphaera cyanobacteriorum]